MDTFLSDLEGSVPTGVADVESGVGVVVEDVVLEFPVEARIESAGLWLSTPRGRMITGFDRAHGRVQIRFSRTELA